MELGDLIREATTAPPCRGCPSAQVPRASRGKDFGVEKNLKGASKSAEVWKKGYALIFVHSRRAYPIMPGEFGVGVDTVMSSAKRCVLIVLAKTLRKNFRAEIALLHMSLKTAGHTSSVLLGV